MTAPLRLTRHAGVALEVLAYLFWLAVDMVAAISIGLPRGAATTLAGCVVAGIVLSRRRVPLDRVVVPAFAASLLFSVVSVALGAPSMSFTEQLALAVVTVVALRNASDRRVLWVAAAALAAIVLSPVLRTPVAGTSDAFSVLSALGWGGAVAIGLVWRETAARRRAALTDARSAERMELARELHDVVAHQVTGIVVAAQAASVVARTSPDDVDRALAAIERAGTDALTAMRQMVGVLRGGEEATRTLGAELGEIPDLIARFDPSGELVRLRADPGFAHAVLPAGVAATGFRVVQEALTNVRRHAPEATAVEVEIGIGAEELRVAVRNDGVRARREGGGGFGITGMAERVAALNGALTAGPAGPGTWAVDARVPLR
ncbi:histidine kinase [Pseudonocardia sp. WMMC193]|uniref:sensor histidine kinase n=1 Tax=Pseudonocardia sp. WMMC193 TaxID=2911965 RepID=UPI0027DEDB1E|nr:histidine kinase [Pseudonocardia sp. WMMC193]